MKKFSGGKTRLFEGVPNARAGVDVIFIDCPENLPVPGLSKSAHVVPPWNADPDDEALQFMCSFATEHLHDDGCIVLFHSYSRKSKENIAGVCEAYNLVQKKDWMGMNRMHLTSAIDNAKTIQKFGVTLLVKDLGSKGISKFSFKTTATMMKVGVDVGTDDMLMNYTHADDMAMNGDSPWRGGREKDPRFFTILLEATSVTGDLILDCTASTGACITACRGTSRHIVALEGNKDIFDAILKPMKKPVVVTPLVATVGEASEDPDDMPVVACKFIHKGKSKARD